MKFQLAGVLCAVLVVLAVFLTLSGPDGPGPDGRGTLASGPEVVCYAALDREFSEPILRAFEQRTGIRVRMKFDTEADKTIALTGEILEMHRMDRQGCDVFWNNEPMNTIRLQKAGVLRTYRPKAASRFPLPFQSPTGTWTGFAARARVLIVNTDLVAAEDRPRTMKELRAVKTPGLILMADPQAGSTATWFATLYAQHLNQTGSAPTLPDASISRDMSPFITTQMEALLALIVRPPYGPATRVRIGGGNKHVARAVADGDAIMGFTDTDDAIIEKEAGKPVELIYLDRQSQQEGTLFFPNTLAIMKKSPNPDQAIKLVEYLLSPEVEILLAKSSSAQLPVNPAIQAGRDFPKRIPTPAEVKPMAVDWAQVAEVYEDAAILAETLPRE